jgi:hypothetical protein
MSNDNKNHSETVGAAAGAATNIAPGDPEYPPYILVFEGLESKQVVVEGPHTEMLRIGNPEITVALTVAHNETEDGPNLTIKIARLTE